MKPEMFDRVRIRSTPETEALGYADAVGELQGFTTPSITGVMVIGPHDDAAIAVDFDGDRPAVWFAPHLVAFEERPAVTVEVGGRELCRPANGQWSERRSRSWWQFWRR
jgi:hypothetical protein